MPEFTIGSSRTSIKIVSYPLQLFISVTSRKNLLSIVVETTGFGIVELEIEPFTELHK